MATTHPVVGPVVGSAQSGLQAVIDLLQQSWPAFLTLTPAMIGLDSDRQVEGDVFLRLVQSLSDDGLITYEALVVGPELGARAIDAALTARGRAQFSLALSVHS